MEASKIARDLYLKERVGSARSVLQGLRRARLLEFSDEVLMSATAFNRGLGSRDEICGALAAAAMAIGLRFGRDRQDQSLGRKLVNDLKDEFRQEYASLNCGDLTRGFADFEGPERREHCARLVEFVTDRLSNILAGPDATIPSLRELINHINRLPAAERTVSHLRDLLLRTHISEAEIEKCLIFSKDSYARNLFYKSRDFEILVMCWKSGQQSPIHDHDTSMSIERVFSGRFEFINYYRVDPDRDEIYQGETIEGLPGDVSEVEAGAIHKLANPAEAGLDGVTIHFYFPPLKRMKCFNLERKTAQWQKLGYLYIYNPDAWQSLSSCSI